MILVNDARHLAVVINHNVDIVYVKVRDTQ